MASAKEVLQKDKWGTPDNIYLPLHAEFGFSLDPCCEHETAKCLKHYTPAENGLLYSWTHEICFVNPPYSRGNIDKWVKKCYEESLLGTVVVALLPVSTSSAWFHDWVLGKAEIRFIRGRIQFVGAPQSAPFSSLIAIYK